MIGLVLTISLGCFPDAAPDALDARLREVERARAREADVNRRKARSVACQRPGGSPASSW